MTQHSPLGASLRDPRLRQRTPDLGSGVSSGGDAIRLPDIPELHPEIREVTGPWRKTINRDDVWQGDLPEIDSKSLRHAVRVAQSPRVIRWGWRISKFSGKVIRLILRNLWYIWLWGWTGRWGRRERIRDSDQTKYLTMARSAIKLWNPPSYVSVKPQTPRTAYHDLRDKFPEVWATHRWGVGDRYVVPARHSWIRRLSSKALDETPRVSLIVNEYISIPTDAIWAPTTAQLEDIADSLGIPLVSPFLKADNGTWAKWVAWIEGREQDYVAEIEMDEALIAQLLKSHAPSAPDAVEC